MGVPLPRGLTFHAIMVWEAAPLSRSLRGREVMTEVEKKILLITRKEEVQRRRVRQETGKYAVSENHLSGDVSHSERCIMNYLFIHPFHSVGIKFMTAELHWLYGSVQITM